MSHHLYLEVFERPAMLVSGWPVLGAFDDLLTQVPAVWDQVRQMLPPPPEGYAVARNELGDGRYHEVVGVLVGPDDAPPGPLTVRLPAGTYLHTRYAGALDGITTTFQTLSASAAARGYRIGTHTLDVGYTFGLRRDSDSEHEAHDLWLQVHRSADADST